MSRDDLIPAGEVLKVHGLEGGLVLRFRELFCPLERIPAFVFLKIDGLPVPFPVEEVQEYGECSWLFFFEDVTDRDKALRYRGKEVLLGVLTAGNWQVTSAERKRDGSFTVGLDTLAGGEVYVIIPGKDGGFELEGRKTE